MPNARQFLLILIVIGTGIVFYLSWLPNPNIGLKPYFPQKFGAWVNENGNLRTAVPFVILGFAGESIQVIAAASAWKRRGLLLALLIGIVSIAEIGQIFLPARHPDWEDIGWGTFGAVIGILTGSVFSAFISKMRPGSRNRIH